MSLFVGLLGADGGAWARHLLGHDQRTKQIAGLMQIAGLPGVLRPLVPGLARTLGQKRLAETIRSLKPMSADQLWHLQAERNRYRAQFLAALDGGRYNTTAASYSMIYNLLHMPAGVVPITRVRAGEESDRKRTGDVVERAAYQVEQGSAGLPIGVQVVAHHWREDVALALMAVLEAQARTLSDYPLHPPI